MSVGERQRLELLRALDADPEVLLLDEPTAVLTDSEADRFLAVIRRLADDGGKAVVLITHRLREVVEAADRVAVMRNGMVVSPPAPVGTRTRAELAHEMVGEELPPVGRTSTTIGRPIVEVTGLRLGRLTVEHLVVRAGEVLGVAGVDGNGQSELELAVAGLAVPETGTIAVDGDDISGLHPRQRVAKGIAYIPSDRAARALVGTMRCDENLVLGRTTWRCRRDSAAAARMAAWSIKGAPAPPCDVAVGRQRAEARGGPRAQRRAGRRRRLSTDARPRPGGVDAAAPRPPRVRRSRRRRAVGGRRARRAAGGRRPHRRRLPRAALRAVPPTVRPSSRRPRPGRRRVTAALRASDRGGVVAMVVTPLLSVVAALAVGAVIIAWAGENPWTVYETVFSEALFSKAGWRDTLIRATPLVLIGVGLGLGFAADVWNIGAEGQMIVGALCSIAVIGYVNDLPGVVLIPLGLLLGAVGGGLWGALAGWLHVRRGVNVVIATLLLAFIAEPLVTWAVRDPLKDPESYLPQSRVVGNAALPQLDWLGIHIGVFLVLIVVPVAAWLVSSTRLGYLIRAHGGNRTATTANEVRPGRMSMGLLILAGSLAGVAGFVQLAGVQTRVASGTAAGFGFTAIIVAIVGRNHPVGVLVSAVGFSAMLVGAEAAQRDSGLPVSSMQTIQALVVVFVVGGDALAARLRARRRRPTLCRDVRAVTA